MEIIRKEYLDKLEDLKDKHFIKVLTGIRRSGKSTILCQFQELLKNKYKVSQKQIQYFDFNNKLLTEITWKDLTNDILSKSSNSITNYIFLDEIQEIKEFEKVVITLFEYKKIKFDVYITGSNSQMFSTKLATLFTGRNAPIHVLPISFDVIFKNLHKEKNKNNAFNEYLAYGGLGIIVPNFTNKVLLKETLSWVLSDTINKDVKARHKIKKSESLDKLTKFVFSNIGHIISANKIEKYLKSSKETKLTGKTIIKQLEWLCEALVLFKVKYYDIKGKSILKTKAKYYAGDLGILSSTTSYDVNKEIGFRLENLVYLELLNRDYKVYTYADKYDREIDFVCEKNNKISYWQVTRTLSDKNLERETNSLLSVKDNYPKTIITLEDDSKHTNNGIDVFNIVDWLLE